MLQWVEKQEKRGQARGDGRQRRGEERRIFRLIITDEELTLQRRADVVKRPLPDIILALIRTSEHERDSGYQRNVEFDVDSGEGGLTRPSFHTVSQI